jgi:hypothetical protein
MNHRNEHFHYSHPCDNAHQSPAHLSGFMYAPPWEHSAEDEVPTISVDHGLSDMMGSTPGGYLPSSPATPSEDGQSASSVDFGLWPQEMTMGNSFNNMQSNPSTFDRGTPYSTPVRCLR